MLLRRHAALAILMNTSWLQVYTNFADAAAALVSYWKEPAHAQLLRRPLPAEITGQQILYMFLSIGVIYKAAEAAVKAELYRQYLQKEGLGTLSEQLLLHSTFAAQPVATLARSAGVDAEEAAAAASKHNGLAAVDARKQRQQGAQKAAMYWVMGGRCQR
jgi:hypothetical protein